jgi:hypothetical protein
MGFGQSLLKVPVGGDLIKSISVQAKVVISNKSESNLMAFLTGSIILPLAQIQPILQYVSYLKILRRSQDLSLQ